MASITDAPEFLVEPGLIHLNTGTFGLMPRHVRERVKLERGTRHGDQPAVGLTSVPVIRTPAPSTA